MLTFNTASLKCILSKKTVLSLKEEQKSAVITLPILARKHKKQISNSGVKLDIFFSFIHSIQEQK